MLLTKISTKRGLQRLEDGAQRHAEDLCLVAIDVEVDRGVGCRERAEHAVQLRILIGGNHQSAHDLRKRLRVAATEIF